MSALRVEDITRGVVLVDRGRVAGNAWTRLVGLIGVKALPAGDGLLIVPCSGIHCMFMSIPIDVLYADRADRVVALDRDMQPWSVGRPHRGVRYVVELPAGTIARTGVQVGDQLKVSR
jgi:uncharacterized membrane protein (UPF0127 family)